MYRQINRVAIGSSLNPALDNIFAGFYEKKLFSQIAKPQVYFRYVDNTYVIFHHEDEVSEFLIMLNNLHPSLKFIFEKEMDKQLPFLGTIMYLKQKSTGNPPLQDNTSDGVFLFQQPKIKFISTLVYRALKICTKNHLKQEMKKISIGNHS